MVELAPDFGSCFTSGENITLEVCFHLAGARVRVKCNSRRCSSRVNPNPQSQVCPASDLWTNLTEILWLSLDSRHPVSFGFAGSPPSTGGGNFPIRSSLSTQTSMPRACESRAVLVAQVCAVPVR